MRYIEVYKEEVPYTAQVVLPSRVKGGNGTRLYDLTFDYNNAHDFFTLTIELDGDMLMQEEKLVLDYPMLDYYRDARLPSASLVMRNRPRQQGEVNYKNMGDTVLLAIEGDNDAII